MWPDTPPLARDYAFASGVRSDETIAQLDEHHQHLREKLALTGPPHHVWENPIFAKQELNLPHGETISYTRSFKSVLNSRKSARFTNTELKSISLRSLASILYDSASFSKRPTTNEQKSGNIHFRSAPSAGPDPRKVDTSGASYAALVSIAEVSVSKTSGATRLHQECRRRVL